MFRKIVSNLSFSPALVGQLSFYAKRLRKEETTRRLGLIFVALALIVQGLTVFQPSESANAASQNDLVYGGLGLGANRSINHFLAPYDANTNNLKDITTYIGITRDEIVASQYSSFLTASDTYSWGHNAKYSPAQGEKQISVTNANGQAVTTVYARPLTLSNGSGVRIYAWIGHSAKIGWFAIMQACGNIVTKAIPSPPPPPPKMCVYNNSILASSEDCQPCPGNTSLWIKDTLCVATITESKSAINTSQGSIDASSVTAKESDTIVYTIKVKNTGLNAKVVHLTDDLTDVLEYSTLIDKGGGTFNDTTKVLSWPDVNLAPAETQERAIAIKVLDSIPATAQGASEPTSYDCVMSNLFGETVLVKVPCAPPKVIEKVVAQLPHTGPTENILFAGFVLSIATFFYARTRVVKKEVRLIRRHLNSGTI